jgi:maleate isomerase
MSHYQRLTPHLIDRRVIEPPGLAFAALSTDEIGDAAMREVIGPGVRLFVTRVAYEEEGPEGDAFSVRGGFAGMAATLPPPDSYSVFAFACTSALVSMTRERFVAELTTVMPGKQITAPALAASAVCQTANIRRLALLTPYPRKLHERFVRYFGNDGISITRSASFELNDDVDITSVPESDILDGARLVCRDEQPDALFISCGAFYVVPFLPKLANALQIPVFSSIQALGWHARTLLGIQGAGPLVMPQAT